MAQDIEDRVFQLLAGSNRKYALFTDQPVSLVTATAAWSYAVRYSAKGLDLPDYDAAVALLKQRHPGWEVFESQLPSIGYDKSLAESDAPDAK